MKSLRSSSLIKAMDAARKKLSGKRGQKEVNDVFTTIYGKKMTLKEAKRREHVEARVLFSYLRDKGFDDYFLTFSEFAEFLKGEAYSKARGNVKTEIVKNIREQTKEIARSGVNIANPTDYSFCLSPVPADAFVNNWLKNPPNAEELEIAHSAYKKWEGVHVSTKPNGAIFDSYQAFNTKIAERRIENAVTATQNAEFHGLLLRDDRAAREVSDGRLGILLEGGDE
jgi:hypothetical protein